MALSLSVAELRESFKTIPAEIHDQICDAVFTAPAGPIDLTDRSNPAHKLSFKLLRISRSTRAAYAASYYSREFCFRADLFMHSISPFLGWYASIPPAHARLLTKITLIRNNNNNLESNEYLAWIVGSCRETFVAHLGTVVADKIVYELPNRTAEERWKGVVGQQPTYPNVTSWSMN